MPKSTKTRSMACNKPSREEREVYVAQKNSACVPTMQSPNNASAHNSWGELAFTSHCLRIPRHIRSHLWRRSAVRAKPTTHCVTGGWLVG
eukprot:361612-Chlamydomonas_euryale.AAC.23